LRPHVASVESNLKGGVAHALAPRTLIVGPNGAGKDALLNTVALALTGIADDVLGRDAVKDPAMVLTLGDASGVTARARLSTGTLCEYEAARGADGTAKKPVTRNTYPDAYPLRAVRDALSGSADKARAFLLAQVSASITEADILYALPVEVIDTYNRAVGGVVGATPVDRLLALTASAKKRAADADGQGRTLGESINRAAETLGAEPLALDVHDATERAAQARSAYEAALTAPDLRTLQGRAVEAVEAYKCASENARTLRASVTAAGASARVADMTALAHAARWHHDKGIGACALCSSPVPGGRETFAARLADIEAARAVWEERARSEVRAEEAEREAQRLRGEAERAIVAFESAGGAGALATYADRDALRARYEEAQARAATLANAASGWKNLRSFRTDHARCMEDARAFRALHDATRDAIATLLDRAASQFAARVQRYLPASDTFALRLRDGDREVCRVGFLRDGQLHAALSGAEWARCLLALACAVAETAHPDHPIVLVPPERAFDPLTLAAVLDALADAPGQVILASPVFPARVPDGWTVITLGGAQMPDAAPAPTVSAPTNDADKPKRKRRTKAEMAAFRAAQAAGTAPMTDADDADDADDVGPWFDATALTDVPPVETIARTPDRAVYAPEQKADDIAAFFARVRAAAEAT